MPGSGSIGTAIVNQVRGQASAAYKNAVPLLTNKNLTEVGSSILNFTPIYNEFVHVLFNKVTLEIMDRRRYQNPFRELTKGGSALGGVVQNIHVNPAEAMAYDVNATSRLLQNYRPDVAVEYYHLNRKDLFAVTYAREKLETAFTTYEQLDNFFGGLVDSLYTGNEIREFELYKATMASAYLNDVIKKAPIATPTLGNQSSAKAFIALLQSFSNAFKFPSTNYNNFQALAAKKGIAVNARKTWSPIDRQVIFMDSKLAPIISLEVLASAFNVEYAQLQQQVLYVDDFGVTGLLAIIADVDWMQVRDSKREFRDFENGATLTLSSFFHVWQYFNVCTFVNAMALYDPAAAPIDITANSGVTTTVGVDDTATADVTIEYKGTDYAENANVSFISTNNQLVVEYKPSTKKVKVATSKYAVPGEYTVLMLVEIIVNGVPVKDSVILTINVG